MPKTFILDTNVLLYDPEAFYRFGDNNVVIPVAVIEDLDGFKRDVTELGRNSRAVAHELDELANTGKLGEGVRLPGGGLLRLWAGIDEDFIDTHGLSIRKVGNRLLNLAVYLRHHHPEQETIIVSKNINLRLKADALGIYAEDFELAGTSSRAAIAGIHQYKTSAETIDNFLARGRLEMPDIDVHPNEYLLMHTGDHECRAIARVCRDRTIRKTKLTEDGVCGIRPRNLQQECVLDALLDDDIKLVTLHGKAGTGKTLLAVAAGLHQVIHEASYRRLLISRPTLPMGRDIGFIPGDIEEKMRPWMQPLYDALEMIRESDRRRRTRTLPPDLLESEDIGIEPLTYIRGRSIPNQFFIIDEAQNLTPHEVKTIITRVGHNSKIVLTGDPEQIDNPYVDLRSNGFTYLVDRFRDQGISAHLNMTIGERSELAEIAADIL
jgi:PhoH-like ATPase